MVEDISQKINIISVPQYFSELKQARTAKIAELAKINSDYSGQFKSLAVYGEPYNVLQNILKNKYILTDPNEFVELCNPFLKERIFENHEVMVGYPVPSLYVDKREDRTLIYAEGFPLVWGLENAVTEYAFFRTFDSKNIIDGIYLCNTLLKNGLPNKSMERRNFIIAKECYKELILPIDDIDESLDN